jgi:ABC-2 type transport system permease protein
MSTDTVTTDTVTAGAARVPETVGYPTLRLLGSELRLVFGRRRTQVLLLVLALAPVLIGVAIHASRPRPGEGPPFIAQVTGNGVFLAFTALSALLPLFLPLAVAVVAGETLSGEASLGTLRYLLTVPVDRTRLLLVKYVSMVIFCLAATGVIGAMGMIMGEILFPAGRMTLLSGTSVSLPQALGRIALIALYVAAASAALGAVGLTVSTLTEVPVGAMAGTVGFAVVSQLLDLVPQLGSWRPYFLTHWWLAFGDILRNPIPTHDIQRGLISFAVYTIIFTSIAWARFTQRDVTS